MMVMGRSVRCWVLAVASLVVASGCGILGLNGEVEVRVRNGSGVLLDEATLILPKGSLSFFDLEPGGESAFVVVQKAYQSASGEVVVGQDTARVQVIDYVGETPLEPGRYTYIFRVFEGVPLNMTLEFKKES